MQGAYCITTRTRSTSLGFSLVPPSRNAYTCKTFHIPKAGHLQPPLPTDIYFYIRASPSSLSSSSSCSVSSLVQWTSKLSPVHPRRLRGMTSESPYVIKHADVYSSANDTPQLFLFHAQVLACYIPMLHCVTTSPFYLSSTLCSLFTNYSNLRWTLIPSRTSATLVTLPQPLSKSIRSLPCMQSPNGLCSGMSTDHMLCLPQYTDSPPQTDIEVTGSIFSAILSAFLHPLRAPHGDVRPGYRGCSHKAHPMGLNLTPTRALVSQIHEPNRALHIRRPRSGSPCSGRRHPTAALCLIERGCDPISAIPGRLVDLIDSGRINLANIRYLVFDEADCMLDMCVKPQFRRFVQGDDLPNVQFSI